MPDKKLTDELLNELLDAPNIDGYIKEHDFATPSLSDYLKQLLQEDDMRKPFGSPPPRRSFFPRARDATMGFEYRPVR